MIVINLNFIFNIILFSLFIKNLIHPLLVSKTAILYQYKIIDKKITFILITLYICLIIIGMYIYRILRLGNTLNLFLLKDYFNHFISLDIPNIFKFYFVIQAIIFFILSFLLLIHLNKIAFLEIFKTYIFINYNNFLLFNKYTKYIYNILNNIGYKNIISYFILQINYHIVLFLRDLEISHGAQYKEFEIPKYKISELIDEMLYHRLKNKIRYTFDIFLYYIIPIIIFIYDCIFNEWIVIHVFYYIPFIIPVMLLQRITKTIFGTDNSISLLLWEIYYKEETSINACTTLQKEILDTYLLNKVQVLPGIDLVFLHNHLVIMSKSPLCFTLVEEEKNHLIYQNILGKYAQKQPNGKFIRVIDYYLLEDFEISGIKSFIEYGEELIIIAEKYNDNVHMNSSKKNCKNLAEIKKDLKDDIV